MSTRILAVSGSLRHGSYNSALLGAAAAVAPGGVVVDRYRGLAAIPPFDEDAERDDVPSPVHDLRRAIAGADALLIATPEYNGSIPGHLKTALDWASRPYGQSALSGMPVAVIGASTGAFGAIRAQQELRTVLRTAGARVLDVPFALPHAERHVDRHGRLTSPASRAELAAVLRALVDAAEATAAAA